MLLLLEQYQTLQGAELSPGGWARGPPLAAQAELQRQWDLQTGRMTTSVAVHTRVVESQFGMNRTANPNLLLGDAHGGVGRAGIAREVRVNPNPLVMTPHGGFNQAANPSLVGPFNPEPRLLLTPHLQPRIRSQMASDTTGTALNLELNPSLSRAPTFPSLSALAQQSELPRGLYRPPPFNLNAQLEELGRIASTEQRSSNLGPNEMLASSGYLEQPLNLLSPGVSPFLPDAPAPPSNQLAPTLPGGGPESRDPNAWDLGLSGPMNWRPPNGFD